jgi:hypothetical protein
MANFDGQRKGDEEEKNLTAWQLGVGSWQLATFVSCPEISCHFQSDTISGDDHEAEGCDALQYLF